MGFGISVQLLRMNGWFKAWAAVHLLAGSTINNLHIKSLARKLGMDVP